MNYLIPQQEDKEPESGGKISLKTSEATTDPTIDAKDKSLEPKDADLKAKSQKKKIRNPVRIFPWMMMIPLAIDAYFDGILLAFSYEAAHSAGIIVSISFACFEVVLGILVGTTLKSKEFPILVIYLVVTGFAFLFCTGATTGSLLAHAINSIGALYVGMLSFSIGALLYLITDNLLIVAREVEKDNNWMTRGMLHVGFLIVLIVSVSIE